MKENDVLARVLNFAPAPEKVQKDIIASAEPELRYHDSAAEANVARAAVCNILKKAKPLRENLSREQFGSASRLASWWKWSDLALRMAVF